MNKSLIKKYGCLSIENLDIFAVSYVNKQNKTSQNNHMLVEYLMASITDTCFYKISNEED